jgi:hypothetical protein
VTEGVRDALVSKLWISQWADGLAGLSMACMLA